MSRIVQKAIVAVAGIVFTGILAPALSTSSFSASAQNVSTDAHPTVRVTGKVSNAVVSRLAGTHPSVADSAALGVRLSSSTRLEHMKLVLNSSDDQIVALRTLTDSQQDKSSPNFHKWLTPETFGQYFGPAPADVAQVTAWLQDQGFTIESVAKSNRIIVFSGTVGQVETAFQTQMNTLQVNGETHLSNTTDIAVPAALAPVIHGIASLNDFFPKSGAHDPHKVDLSTYIPAGNSVQVNGSPLFGSSPTGTHYIAPGDAATIYNTTPLLNAGIDGTGTTIAVLARSNITLSDVEIFRTLFGLKKNDPTITVVGTDPGQNGDDVEAYLDAEWSGAMAPGANVNFLVSSASLVSGGIDSAGLYAVENNIGDIISLSYGGCETENGASGTAFYNILWEQAAAQGQTVFVSSGDSSAAGCDSSSSSYAHNGYGVNALGSSAYNVAVGGSMFVDYNPAQFWGTATAIPYASALSYIPEAPWNQGRLSTTYLNSSSTAPVTGSGIAGAGGGVSIYTARPSWQTGSAIPRNADPSGIAPGSPISGLHRLVPDIVNIAASGHDGTLFCYDEGCYLTSTGTLGSAGIVGGTSVATPVMASMQALINQKNGGRQGNANFFYYRLAGTQYAASTSACQAPIGTASAPAVTLPAATCNFHDIVNGDIMVPTAATGTASIGFSAAVGYDEASGLGSLNIANVAGNWSTVSFAATTTAFTITPAAGLKHGAAQIINVTVTPTTASGTPTGDVSLIAETATPNGPFVFTLTNGAVSGTFAGLPAGSYKVHAHYAGDATFGGSDSPSIPVSIAAESSTISITPYLVTPAGSVTYQATFPYGSEIYVDTNVIGLSGTGTATGTVTYSLTRNGVALSPLTTTLDTYANTFFISGQSIPAFYLKANYAALSPGAYVLTAAYSGDNNLGASTTSTSFTVTPLTPTVTFTGPSQITSGAAALFSFSIANPSSTTYPNTTAPATGTVTFTDTTTGTILGSGTLSNGSVSLSTSAITSTGAHTVAAAYLGDANYGPVTPTLIVTVGTLTTPSLTLSTTSTTLAVGATIALRATLSAATATGTVYFYDSGALLGSATATGGIASLSYAGFTAATHNLTATYAGSSTFSSATGSFSLTVGQNSPSITTSVPLNSIYGQTVALSARLTRNPTATGQPAIGLTGVINFYDNGNLIGSGATYFEPSNYAYSALLNVSTLSVGVHTITATYVGDANYKTISSANQTLTVAMATPFLTLSSPSTVYSKSASVPLTATIVLPGTLAAPTAGVTFSNAYTVPGNPPAIATLGTVPVTYSASAGGYVANLALSALPAGTNTITAQYPGDSNYNPATSSPLVITITTNNIWVANSNATASALTSTGSALTSAAVGTPGTGAAIAIDGSGNVWTLNSSANSVAEFTSTGALLNPGFTTGSLSSPRALAFDGAGLLWIANGNNTLSVLTSTGAAASATPLKSLLNTPTSISIDGSGNLWITNSGSNTVTEVIGAATPVASPQANAVTNNTLATKP